MCWGNPEFHTHVSNVFVKFLRSQYDNDNPEHLPWINRVPLGKARGHSGGYLAGCFYVEAYWCNNYYMKTEDPFRQSNSWIADLLPSCPLCQVTRAAWASTAAYFAIPEHMRRKRDPNDSLV